MAEGSKIKSSGSSPSVPQSFNEKQHEKKTLLFGTIQLFGQPTERELKSRVSEKHIIICIFIYFSNLKS